MIFDDDSVRIEEKKNGEEKWSDHENIYYHLLAHQYIHSA